MHLQNFDKQLPDYPPKVASIYILTKNVWHILLSDV